MSETTGKDDWQQCLAGITAEGYRVVDLDSADAEWRVRSLAPMVPAGVLAVARNWSVTGQTAARDPWEVLTSAAMRESPDAREAVVTLGHRHPLRRLASSARHAAVVFGHGKVLISPDRWSYALWLPPRKAGGESGCLRVHRPATVATVALVERLIGVQLPPAYSHMLRVSNGVGLDSGETCALAGVGPPRSPWGAVITGDWPSCEFCHELGARWRFFQGSRSQAVPPSAKSGTAAGAATQHRQHKHPPADLTHLVPFLNTFGGDEWCLDTSRPGDGGELPVVFWDREHDTVTDDTPTFGGWIERELERQVFDDELIPASVTRSGSDGSPAHGG